MWTQNIKIIFKQLTKVQEVYCNVKDQFVHSLSYGVDV